MLSRSVYAHSLNIYAQMVMWLYILSFNTVYCKYNTLSPSSAKCYHTPYKINNYKADTIIEYQLGSLSLFVFTWKTGVNFVHNVKPQFQLLNEHARYKRGRSRPKWRRIFKFLIMALCDLQSSFATARARLLNEANSVPQRSRSKNAMNANRASGVFVQSSRDFFTKESTIVDLSYKLVWLASPFRHRQPLFTWVSSRVPAIHLWITMKKEKRYTKI